MVTTDARENTYRSHPVDQAATAFPLLDPEDDEIARPSPVRAHLAPADLATLDALITAGIAEASRAEAARAGRWPACASSLPCAAQRAGTRARGAAALDRAVLDQLQTRLDEQVKEHFPDGGVQRIALLQHGDEPSVEPGDLLARVFIDEAEEDPPLPAWHRDHETMIRELQHELAERLPGASHLEFWFGENGRQGKTGPPHPTRGEQDLTPAHIGLEAADLEMLDGSPAAPQSAGQKPSAGSWPASANGRPTRGSASGHESWTSSKPASDPGERRRS